MLTIISIVSAILLLSTVLSVYVSPDKFSFFALLGFGFPFIFIINIILLIVWISIRKWRFLIPLVVIVIAWPQWDDLFQWSSGSQVEDVSELHVPLSIMSYNVRMFDFYDWTKVQGNREQLFDFIRKKNPDVLCIQEFFTARDKAGFNENHIIARLGQYPYRYIQYSIIHNLDRKYGIATFSKYPIIKQNQIRFEKTSNLSIQTDIDVKGLKVRVFNNHLESIRLQKHHLDFIDSLNHKNEEERVEGIKEIANKLNVAFSNRGMQADAISKHIENSTIPVIVCGDFNDTPVSYVYRMMRGDLKDAFVESGSGISGTYNGKLPSLRIDFIFHDDDFASYNFERFKVGYSDHYPIFTQLDLKP